MFGLFSAPAAAPAITLATSRNAEGHALLSELSSLPLDAVTSARQIAHILRGLAEAKGVVQLSCHHIARSAATRLLAADCREVVIRQVGDAASHAEIVRDGHINLVSRTGAVPFIGSLDLLDCRDYSGTPCYVAAPPSFLLISQMRASVRVRVSESRHVQLGYSHPARELLVARVTDLSEGGLGLVLPHHPLCGIAPHDHWCNATLGGSEGEIGALELELRRVAQTANGELHLGTSIVGASEGVRQRLRRLMLRLQSRSNH